jgi:hypothetical protein
MGIRDYIKQEENSFSITEQMNGQEIANELGISRQAVSNTLKKGLVKVYKAMKMENNTGPFETAVSIAVGFMVDSQEYKKFFKLFPPAIRKEIEADGSKLIRKK